MSVASMTNHAERHDDHHDHGADKVIFGFWVYLLTEAVLFAVLFTCYVVLRHGTFGGVTGPDQIADLPYVLLQTLCILLCSLFYGFSAAAAARGHKSQTIFYLAIIFIPAIIFLALQIHEFSNLLAYGINWRGSAFLSAFFTLLGIFMLHVIVGLLWVLVLLTQFSFQPLNETMQTRLTCLGLFWNFIGIIWICVLFIVFFIGAV